MKDYLNDKIYLCRTDSGYSNTWRIKLTVYSNTKSYIIVQRHKALKNHNTSVQIRYEVGGIEATDESPGEVHREFG